MLRWTRVPPSTSYRRGTGTSPRVLHFGQFTLHHRLFPPGVTSMNRLSLKTTRRRRVGFESPESGRVRRAMARWHRPGLRLEVLEDRTLPSTLAFPTAGHLQYSGTAAVASDLTISTDGTNYTIHDAVQTITLDPSATGWSNIDPNTVTGPNSSITTISIGTSTADDTVSIQS